MGTNTRPLSSLKVLDFSTLLPGPYASLLLADMGAEVLRVESPTRPDMVRDLPAKVDEDSAAQHYLNRNKRSIALDLKQPEAVTIVTRLVEQYDIVLEQFRPGVMQRLGLDYESLKAVNPRVIYCSISGYGQTGPYRTRAGHDINYLSIAGISSYTGRADAGPLPLGVQLADIAGGSHHAVMGILAAEIRRKSTGEGDYIDISMTDAAFALNAMVGAASLHTGEDVGRDEDWLNGGCFYDYYETSDGRHMSVGGLEPAFVKNLANALAEPRLLRLVEHHNPEIQTELRNLLAQRFIEHNFNYWCDFFSGLDCCVEPVLSVNEAANHSQLQLRNMTLNYATHSGKRVLQVACPLAFASSVQHQPTPAPSTGADTMQVLESLGYAVTEIGLLVAAGVCKTA